MTMLPPVTEDELHAYIDNALDPGRIADIEQHLRAHPGVAERVHDYTEQKNELRAAFGAVDPISLPPRLNLLALIEAQHLAPPRRTSRWRGAKWRGWQVAAMAALVAVSAGTAGWVAGGRPATGVQLIAAEASASFAVFAVDARRPVELWAAQKDDLTRWVSNRLHHPLAPPDLAALGYQFLGGRLVPTAQGPAAMFMYESPAKARLIVFIRPMHSEGTTPTQPIAPGPMDTCAWIDKGVGYSVVAKEPYDRLLELSRHVREQTDLRG
jgi:anti-sigma factor RsiW